MPAEPASPSPAPAAGPGRPTRADPATCPHLVWLRYTRPVRRPAEGTAYNVRCAACGEKAWRG